MSDLLPVLPVDRLTGPLDRFRCTPFRADISVKSCLLRQAQTYTGGRMTGHTPAQHAAHPTCAACELGREVAARVPAAAVSSGCAVCGVPVRGAGKRTPLCPAHRPGARKEAAHVG